MTTTKPKTYALKGPLYCAHCRRSVNPPKFTEENWPDVIILVDKQCGAPLVWQSGQLRIITPADRALLGEEVWGFMAPIVLSFDAKWGGKVGA